MWSEGWNNTTSTSKVWKKERTGLLLLWIPVRRDVSNTSPRTSLRLGDVVSLQSLVVGKQLKVTVTEEHKWGRWPGDGVTESWRSSLGNHRPWRFWGKTPWQERKWHGVGVMKDKEMKLEYVKDLHTLGWSSYILLVKFLHSSTFLLLLRTRVETVSNKWVDVRTKNQPRTIFHGIYWNLNSCITWHGLWKHVFWHTSDDI